MKKIFFLALLFPVFAIAQRQLTTSPDWFILDSGTSVIPQFNAYVLSNANGFALAKIDSSDKAITYSYKNSKNEKLNIWYQFDPASRVIRYFGLSAPNDVMIDFYNHYLKTNLQTCEEVCYINGRTFIYKDHTYIARASQQTYTNGKSNGYASVSFSDSR
jgi:hypothetical protein